MTVRRSPLSAFPVTTSPATQHFHHRARSSLGVRITLANGPVTAGSSHAAVAGHRQVVHHVVTGLGQVMRRFDCRLAFATTLLAPDPCSTVLTRRLLKLLVAANGTRIDVPHILAPA